MTLFSSLMGRVSSGDDESEDIPQPEETNSGTDEGRIIIADASTGFFSTVSVEDAAFSIDQEQRPSITVIAQDEVTIQSSGGGGLSLYRVEDPQDGQEGSQYGIYTKDNLPEYIKESDVTIKSRINRADYEVQKPRSVDLTGSFHVSGLLNFCPRQKYLMHKLDLTQGKDRLVTGSDRLLWAFGRAVESHIRGQLIADLEDKSRIYGGFSCLCGDKVVEGFGDCIKHADGSDIVCSKCNHPVTIDNYVEVDLKNEEYGIVGHADFIYLDADRKAVVCEFKSMAKKYFDDLTRPMGDHILQVNFYRWLLEQSEDFDTELSPYMSIVYACKEYRFGSSPYKEYIIDTREYTNSINTITNQILPKVVETRNAISQDIPCAKICETPEDGTRLKCDCVTQCFSYR